MTSDEKEGLFEMIKEEAKIASKASSKSAIRPDYYGSECCLECWEAMELVFTPEELIASFECFAMKYLWRYKNKNGLEDLQKAKTYIDRAEERSNLYFGEEKEDHRLKALKSMIDKRLEEETEKKKED